MHVIIDARMIGERVHGIARILLEILKAWKDERVDVKVTLLSNSPENLEKQGLLGFYECQKVKSRPFSPGEFIEIPGILKKLGGDLYHAPSIAVPLFEVMPTVITIPDLIPLLYGNPLHKLYCRRFLGNAVQYSRAIIAISENERKNIINTFKCPPDKVHVTLLAASPNSGEPIPWDIIEKKFEIEKPFILFVGNPKPHKNVVGMIEIFDKLCGKFGEPPGLVIISRLSQAIRQKLEDSPNRNRIKIIDYLDDGELDAFYRNAAVFAFPSYYEGFGLPPLEAMKRGCPVVSSDRASLVEAVGEGGIKIDPDNQEAFADAIIEFLKNQAKREEWSARAKSWEGRFSWRRCAMNTLEIYKKAMKDA
jgi:glycosyltransferase involved in cell wall biosynthesis